jgi:hypothetical protein
LILPHEGAEKGVFSHRGSGEEERKDLTHLPQFEKLSIGVSMG